MQSPTLLDLGWTDTRERAFTEHAVDGRVAARVAREDRGAYTLISEAGTLRGDVSGRFRHSATEKSNYPAVGDWVVAEAIDDSEQAVIHSVLPRTSAFVRKVAGARSDGQVVAANVDIVFIVSGLDGGRNLNVRRIERYLTLAWDSGATPVIVLNKIDLCDAFDVVMDEVRPVAAGVSVLGVSAHSGHGIDMMREAIGRGRTAALIGSSGVGKSTLTNALLGDAQQSTNAVRHGDHQGRHTTTVRELIPLRDGGVVIDTPGMRELQLYGDDVGVASAFADVEALAESCRFGDCSHQGEPGCAVSDAIERGTLGADRLKSYRRLQREITHHAQRHDHRACEADKAFTKHINRVLREKHGGR